MSRTTALQARWKALVSATKYASAPPLTAEPSV